jgi:hypothetical protein
VLTVSEGAPRSARELTLTVSDEELLMRKALRAAAPRRTLGKTNGQQIFILKV